jgi:uncharacterized protein (DUF362 family)
MNRREFLKKTAANTAGLMVLGSMSRIIAPLTVHAAQNSEPTLAVASGKDYTKLAGDVLAPLGGISAFVKPGSKVIVKPNMGWNRTPEQAANTHPEIVLAIVQLAVAAGAAKVTVFDRTCNEERLCYDRSGIKPALDKLNLPQVTCDFMDNRRFKTVPIPKGQSITEWEFYQDVLDADCYINVPVAKQHGLTKLSLGFKNIMGVIGGVRGKLHHAIGQRLADLHTVFMPHLTIIDATRMLLRNGPQGGNLEDVKIQDMLVASTDMVATDAYVSTLFGFLPEDLDTTIAAYKAGLGQMALDKMKIITV